MCPAGLTSWHIVYPIDPGYAERQVHTTLGKSKITPWITYFRQGYYMRLSQFHLQQVS